MKRVFLAATLLAGLASVAVAQVYGPGSTGGGGGSVVGAIKSDGAGNFSQANCASLSDAGSGCSGTVGGTPVVFVGATAGAANTYTIAAPTPSTPSFTLIDQYVIRGTISATNTGASTLNVNSTGAKAIESNSNGGLAALVGGELQANLEYDFTYNSTCTCYVVMNTPGSAVVAGTSQTISQAQWANGTVFVVTTASQTLTLPVSTGLSKNSGIFIQTVGQNVTLTPNGADSINGATAGTSLVLSAENTSLVTTDAAGNIRVSPVQTISYSLTYPPGINPNNMPIANFRGPKVIVGIRCSPEVAAGGSATISVVKAASGTALSAGTVLHSGSCNANGTAATDQDLTVTNSTLAAGDRLGITTTGTTIWTSSGIATGVVTVFVR
jgi:hypothetical protein